MRITILSSPDRNNHIKKMKINALDKHQMNKLEKHVQVYNLREGRKVGLLNYELAISG